MVAEPTPQLESRPARDLSSPWLAPVGSQEIWAAGVTYFRSRAARMEEAEAAGGDIFYDKVYEAERPELFFKATPSRARGHLAPIRIREDSTWDVPEPELTLAINSEGKVFGYTIGNDVSSRSIEGENPLYLPQAKVYRGSLSMGPGSSWAKPSPDPPRSGFRSAATTKWSSPVKPPYRRSNVALRNSPDSSSGTTNSPPARISSPAPGSSRIAALRYVPEIAWLLRLMAWVSWSIRWSRGEDGGQDATAC